MQHQKSYSNSRSKYLTIHCCHRLAVLILILLSTITLSNAQCDENYEWAVWDNFSGNSATGRITVDNNRIIAVTMSANYPFNSTPTIWEYNREFSNFDGAPPNTTVPRTTWATGPGGITTMCFSEVVSNPALMLASVGQGSIPVTLQFSRPYTVAFNGSGMTYTNDTTLIGNEGNAILVFPGNFDCVTIYSSTPEDYTNITWGLNPPLFSVDITVDDIACGSTTLLASGGVSYQWSAGETPNEARNTFNSSGNYFLTVTDADGCSVVTSQSVEIETDVTDISFSSIEESICQGETYMGYASPGPYVDTIIALNGCINIQTLDLTVLPNSASNVSATICQDENYDGYSTSGTYMDEFIAANGCDSIRTLSLTVNPTYREIRQATICRGMSYDFNGQLISEEGIYSESFLTTSGCDSTIILNLEIAKSDFLGRDTFICSESEYQLNGPIENTLWFDNTIGKTKKVNTDGAYWASIIDANGCEIIDTVFVQFNFKSFVPNIFSPNDDGINDCFLPNFSKNVFVSYKFSIYNRWGGLIFSSYEPSACWNGRRNGEACDVGVYVYAIEVETAFCKKNILKGDVTLIK